MGQNVHDTLNVQFIQQYVMIGSEYKGKLMCDWILCYDDGCDPALWLMQAADQVIFLSCQDMQNINQNSHPAFVTKTALM